MTCYLCGGKKTTVLRTKLRNNIKRNVRCCSTCDFVFLQPIDQNIKAFYTKKTYRKKYGPVYQKTSSPKEIFDIYYPLQKDIVKEIAPLLRKDMKVLDVGCSTGHFLASLKGKVGLRVGIELSKEEADFANSRQDFTVYNDPLETLTLSEGPFDLITALQVVEHIEDPVTFLKNLKKHLAPGGFLYIELPNIQDPLLSVFENPGYLDFYYREPHFSYFSTSTLKRLLDKAGFTGKIGTIQRYNVLNHLHWMNTNEPEKDCVSGLGKPILVRDGNTHLGDVAKRELNDFIAKADTEYKKIIQKNGLGESLTFLGQVKK